MSASSRRRTALSHKLRKQHINWVAGPGALGTRSATYFSRSSASYRNVQFAPETTARGPGAFSTAAHPSVAMPDGRTSVGCNAGYLPAWLILTGKKDVVGIDLNERLIRYGQRICEERGINVALRMGDFLKTVDSVSRPRVSEGGHLCFRGGPSPQLPLGMSSMA